MAVAEVRRDRCRLYTIKVLLILSSKRVNGHQKDGFSSVGA